MSKIPELFAIVKRLSDLNGTEHYAPVPKARSLPADYAGSASRLEISADRYGKMTPDLLALVGRMRAKLVDEERARGEKERDELLAKYALEIEALRDVLPSLAATVAVEIGITARALASEAKSGSIKE